MSESEREAGVVVRGLERASDAVSRVPAIPTAVATGVVIAVLVAFGIAQRAAFPEWRLANLDTEASIATFFSATLLWAAAACWLFVAMRAQPGHLALRVWWLLLVWLALDEGNAFHERLERWSGVDWQILYAPLLATGVVAWWGLVRRYRDLRDVGIWLVAGAGAWGIALVLELIQNWGGSPARAAIYDPTMIAEEALEMIGSTAMLIAAVLVLGRDRTSASESGSSRRE